MGRIVVTEFISIDGVAEDPGGAEDYAHGGWSFQFDRGEKGGQFKFSETMNAEVMLLGRVTYEGFAAAWPTRPSEPFTDRMNSIPKYVVSSTLTDATWQNSTVLSGDPVQEVTALRDRIDGDVIVHGSLQLVRLLVANDLVDEYRLMVFPVILGSGKRLWGDDAREAPAKLTVDEYDRDGEVQLLVLHPQR